MVAKLARQLGCHLSMSRVTLQISRTFMMGWFMDFTFRGLISSAGLVNRPIVTSILLTIIMVATTTTAACDTETRIKFRFIVSTKGTNHFYACQLTILSLNHPYNMHMID